MGKWLVRIRADVHDQSAYDTTCDMLVSGKFVNVYDSAGVQVHVVVRSTLFACRINGDQRVSVYLEPTPFPQADKCWSISWKFRSGPSVALEEHPANPSTWTFHTVSENRYFVHEDCYGKHWL